jgi:hypothetical protein
MNERERLLAEGPRVAPEPATADGSMLTTPTPTPTPTTPRPSPAPTAPTAPQDRAKKMPRGLMRLFPLALFGVVLAANAGAGKYAIWVILPIAVAAILFRFVRKAGK